MAILSSRHANQQTVQLYDFSGGLNTTSSVDGIAANQLSECVNMEIDSATNRLRTVAGTKDVFVPGKSIFAAAHDSINHKILYVDEGKTVYVTDFSSTVSVGKLTGALYPITANWEDGLLVASGGHLQYYNGNISLAHLCWRLSDIVSYSSEQQEPQLGWLNSVAYRYGRPVICSRWEASKSTTVDKILTVFNDCHTAWYADTPIDEGKAKAFTYKPVITNH